MVRVDDAGREDRTVGIEPLAGDFEPELVQSQKVVSSASARDSVVHVGRHFSMSPVGRSTADAVQFGGVSDQAASTHESHSTIVLLASPAA